EDLRPHQAPAPSPEPRRLRPRGHRADRPRRSCRNRTRESVPMSDAPNRFEGTLHDVTDARVAIVASRFNHFIVDRLVDGAFDALVRHGVSRENVVLAHVPGAYELPLVVQRMAKSGKFDAVIGVSADRESTRLSSSH